MGGEKCGKRWGSMGRCWKMRESVLECGEGVGSVGNNE